MYDVVQIDKGSIPEYVGFEIELAGISTDTLARAIPKDSGFVSMRDDSIKTIDDIRCSTCQEPHYVVKDVYGAELVSPKIHISKLLPKIGILYSILKPIVEKGAHANITTGTHVHVDAVKLGGKHLCRTYEIFCSVEDPAFKMFLGDLPFPRVLWADRSNFSKSMRRFDEMFYRPKGEKAFDNMPDKYWSWFVSRHTHTGASRYTVEYRLFNATTDPKKLLHMIYFSLGCTYLGVIEAEAGPPSFFEPEEKKDEDGAESVRNIVRLGRRLVEVFEQ